MIFFDKLFVFAEVFGLVSLFNGKPFRKKSSFPKTRRITMKRIKIKGSSQSQGYKFESEHKKRLVFELVNSDVTIKYVNHYATGTSLVFFEVLLFDFSHHCLKGIIIKLKCIFPTPSYEQDAAQGQFLSRF